MRLISKFHDYYDTPFRGSASDPKYTFVRESKDVYVKGVELLEFDCTVGTVDLHFTSGLMGFCGKIYPFLVKHGNTPIYDVKGRIESFESYDEHYYTWEDFADKNPSIVTGRAKQRGWTDIKLRTIKEWLDKGYIRRWHSEFTGINYQPLLNIFTTERVAYFVSEKKPGVYGNRVVTYPRLTNYQFYKVFDTYSTFQKIEMFLTNDLSNPDNPYIMPVPDKIKAESHGFNKWSFRKEKTIK